MAVVRIAGTNRYDTAAKVSAAMTPGAIGSFLGKKTAFLASGSSFADALAAGPLAYKGVVPGGAPHPILLTAADALSAETDAALTAGGITQVVILGGTGVVSAAVQTAVEAKGITVIRIAGTDRNDTAAQLAGLAVKASGLGGFGFAGANVCMANGTNAFGGFDALVCCCVLRPEPGTARTRRARCLPRQRRSSRPTTRRSRRSTSWVAPASSTLTPSPQLGRGGDACVADRDVQQRDAGPDPHQGHVLRGGVAQHGHTNLDFKLNNGAPGVGFVATIANPAASGTPAVAMSYDITLAAPLAAGDLISFPSTGNTITAPDGRLVLPASATTAADTTAPAATVLAATNNAFFRVAFSEPVTLASAGPLGLANYTAIDGPGNVPPNPALVLGPVAVVTADPAGNPTVVQVFTNRNLLPGDVVGIKGGVIADLSTAPIATGNKAAASSRTVIADNVAPTLVSGTQKITDVTPAVLNVDNTGNCGATCNLTTLVKYVSKLPGASGNGTSIRYTAATTNTTEVVTVAAGPPAAITVQMRPGGSTPAQIVAAINVNINSNSRVLASTDSTTTTVFLAPAGPFPLAGGTSNVQVKVTFSEVVNFVAGNIATTVGQAGITPAIGGAVAVVETSGTTNTYTVNYTGVTFRPTGRHRQRWEV